MTEFFPPGEEKERIQKVLNLILEVMRVNNIDENTAGQVLINLAVRIIAYNMEDDGDENLLNDLRQGIKLYRKELKEKDYLL